MSIGQQWAIILVVFWIASIWFTYSTAFLRGETKARNGAVHLPARLAMTEELERRKWCYVQNPPTYGIAPCSCGNDDTQWSEYKGRLWCTKCEVDFVPEHNGIFDGSIPVATSAMLGISFDRINLETNEIEPFEIEVGLAR